MHMRTFNLYLPVLMFVTFVTYATGVIAESVPEIAISETIKHQWNKPNHTVETPVIAVSNDYAVADWIQEPKGGRALLRLSNGQWQTLLCGDAKIKSVSELKKVGVPESDALAIVESLNIQEANLTVSQLNTINTFVGIVDLLLTPQHHH